MTAKFAWPVGTIPGNPLREISPIVPVDTVSSHRHSKRGATSKRARAHTHTHTHTHAPMYRICREPKSDRCREVHSWWRQCNISLKKSLKCVLKLIGRLIYPTQLVTTSERPKQFIHPWNQIVSPLLSSDTIPARSLYYWRAKKLYQWYIEFLNESICTYDFQLSYSTYIRSTTNQRIHNCAALGSL